MPLIKIDLMIEYTFIYLVSVTSELKITGFLKLLLKKHMHIQWHIKVNCTIPQTKMIK